MAYMDEMALEREKSKQAMIAGKTPMFGADTTAAMHALGISLGVIPPGTPPGETTQVLANLLKGGPGKVKVDEASPLKVQPLVGQLHASLQPQHSGGDEYGNILGNVSAATTSALQRLQQQRQGTAPQWQGPNQPAAGPPAGPGANRARLSGNTSLAKGNDLAGVDPQIAQSAKEWAQIYNSKADGAHTAQFTSGNRPGDPREHGRGNAFDMQLIDKSTGKALENYRTNDPKTFAAYQDYANGYHQYLEANYPDLAAKHRWGGYFSGDTSTYGSLDQMHHDFAGDRIGMAGGSWKNGLTPQQAKLFPGLTPGTGGLAGKPAMAPGRPALTTTTTPTSGPAAASTSGAAATPAPAAGPNGAVSLHAGEYPTAAALQDKSVPVGDRFNNPFNMWHDGYASVHGGKPGIQVTQYDTPAVYANKEAGAAAAIQKMAQSPMYSGKTMQDMIGQWVGHGQSYAPIIEGQTGISRNTKITPEFLASPDGLKFLKAMARYETDSSKPYNLTDAQWEKARRVALSNPPALANSIPPKAQPAAAPTAAPQASTQATPQAAAQPAAPAAPVAAPPKADAPVAPQASPQLGPSGEEPLVPEPTPAQNSPTSAPPPAVVAPTPAAAAAAPAPPPAAAAPVPAPVAKPAPPAPPPKPAAPAVNPAHAVLDTKVIDLVKRGGTPAQVAQVPDFIGNKTLREAMQTPLIGGQVAAGVRPYLGKMGITPQQFDQAVKEGPPKPATLGKRSDLGTSDATDFSSRGRTPAAPDQVPTPSPRPANAPSEPMNQAVQDLKLTPQEQALYQRHLDNLHGPGGVDNPDGSRSTLYQTNVEIDGKHYNLPTVYDGKIVSPDEAVARAKAQGLDKFPSYDSPQQAEDRYGQMHQYMDRDTGAYFDKRRGAAPPETPQTPQPAQPQMTPGIAKALEGALKIEEQAPAAPPSAGAMPVLPAQPAAPTPGPGSGGLSLAPEGLSAVPTGALLPGAAPSQGGGIAMAGMLPEIQNATYSTPLIDQTAASGSTMGMSPIPMQTLGSWGWGGGSMGTGLDWGSGTAAMPMIEGFE